VLNKKRASYYITLAKDLAYCRVSYYLIGAMKNETTQMRLDEFQLNLSLTKILKE